MVKTGQVWAGTFVTLDATGALEAGTPSGVLYVDGVADAATVTITGSNPYKFSVTLPTLTAGQRVDMYITATISTIATAGIVASEQADTLLLSDGVTLADDAIKASKFDESTAYPLKSADTGATALARTGADSDTLETLSDQMDAIKTETASIFEDTNELQAELADGGRTDLLIDEIKAKTDTITTPPTAESVADAVWDEAIADHTTATTFGGKNQKVVPSETINDYKADVSGLATATNLSTTDGKVDEIKAKTDLIPATPAQAGEYTAAIAAIPTTGLTAQQVWEYVTRELTSSSGGGATAQEVWEYATRVLTAGTNIDLSALATAADLAALDGKVDTVDGILDDLHGTDIPAIKAKTDVIPASPAAAGEYTAAIAAIQADLDNPAQYKADVSGIPAAVWGYATRTLSSFGSLIADIWSHVTRTLSSFGFTVATNSDANVTAIKAKTDNLPANTATALAAVQADLDNPAQYKADVSGLATATDLATVDGIVDAIKAKTDTIPATPAQAGEYTAAIAAIPTSPLLAANYVAPDNASIGAIKTKTDQLVFTTPNKVDATATVDPTGIATSDELEIIGEKVDGVLNKLNVSSVEFVTAVVGTTITILRGDTLSARLLDLGDLTQYASLDFTVKRVAGELDDAAKIRLRKNASGADDGLLRLNGAEHTSLTDGSIVIDDTTTGDIEIKLNAAATQKLVPGNYVYDVQLITSNNVKTLTAGKLKVDADVTRATV